MQRTRVGWRVVLTGVGLGLAAVGCGGAGTTAAGTPGTTGAVGVTGTTVAVMKDVLAVEKDPPGAPGRTLTLIRYTIAPGAKLAPHIHPGVQLAAIESGTLTYTVTSGTATVTRAGGAADAVTGPTTVTLGPGDAVAENDGMVHFGANETAAQVVILATLLTEDGRDLAVTVTTAP
jgi:quercetin dioxygenase-like cupin family protein